MTTIEAIGPSQINVLGGDIVTVKVGATQGIRVPVGEGKTRPANPDDVFSITPDGAIEGRPPGSAGPYERGLMKPDRIVWNPIGPDGRTFLLPFSAEVPNA